MPRGSSREFRTKYDGAAAALGFSGTPNRLVDSGFIAKARGALEAQGFPIAGGNVSRIFQANADLAQAELNLAAFTAQTQSIDFNGTDEDMGTAVTGLLGIADAWSIAGWFKPGTVPRNTNLVSTGGGLNDITIFLRSTVGTSPSIQVTQNNSAGNLFRNQAWDALTLPQGQWHHFVITWIGNNTNTFYFDGVDQGPPGFTQATITGTMADSSNRGLRIAQAFINRHDGPFASVGIWSSVLASAEVTTIFNAGSIDFNLREDSGNYASAASLQHWIELGKQPSPLLGADAGIASLLLDLEAGANNITDADRVADVPT